MNGVYRDCVLQGLMRVTVIDFACSVRLRVCEHKLIKLYAKIISVNLLCTRRRRRGGGGVINDKLFISGALLDVLCASDPDF